MVMGPGRTVASSDTVSEQRSATLRSHHQNAPKDMPAGMAKFRWSQCTHVAATKQHHIGLQVSALCPQHNGAPGSGEHCHNVLPELSDRSCFRATRDKDAVALLIAQATDHDPAPLSRSCKCDQHGQQRVLTQVKHPTTLGEAIIHRLKIIKVNQRSLLASPSKPAVEMRS